MCRSLLLTAALPTLRLPANTNNSCTAGTVVAGLPGCCDGQCGRAVPAGRDAGTDAVHQVVRLCSTGRVRWSTPVTCESKTAGARRDRVRSVVAEPDRNTPDQRGTRHAARRDPHRPSPAASASRHRTGHLPLRRRTQLRLVAPRIHTSPSWLGTTSRHPRSPSRTRLLPHHPPTGRLIVLAVVEGTALAHRQWTGCKGDHGDHLIRDGCGSPSWSSPSAVCVSHAPVSAPLSCLGRPTRRERKLLVARDDFIPDRYELRRCALPSDPSQRCLECRSPDDLVKCAGHLKFVRSRMVMTACRSGIRDTTPRV